MLIYFILLIIPLFLAWSGNSSPLLFGSYFIVMVVFCGLRNQVGPDWYSYINLYEIHQFGDFSDGLSRPEPLFFILNRVSDSLGLGIYGTNFVCAFLFLFGVFTYARTTANPWLAIAVVIPYLTYIIALSGIRQAAAIGVAYYMLAKWGTLRLVSKLFLVAVAVGFHTSALIFVAFIVLLHPMSKWIKAPAILLTASLAVLFGSGNDQISRYSDIYVAQNLESSGAWAHVSLVAVPALIYLLLWRRFQVAGWADPVVTIGSLATLAALPLLPFSSTGVDRFTLYFSFVQMSVYPALTVAFKGWRSFLLLCVTVIPIFVFIVYFFFGTFADRFIPYNNIIFN